MLQPLLTLVVLAAVFSALFLPAAILLAALFTLGAGFLLPPLSVFFHDIIEEADGPAGEVIDRYLRFSEEPEEETTRGTA